MTPARFRWGLFLILLGLLLLLQNFDVLSPNFWIDLAILFPIVLIAVGIEKIFAKTKLRAISYLTSIALFFGGLAIAFYGSSGGEESSFWDSYTFRQETRESVQSIQAELELDDTNLEIRDSGNDLVYAHFGRYSRKPKINYTVGDVARFDFESRSGAILGGAVQIHTDDPYDWSFRFNENIPLDLICRGKDSRLDLNMSTTPLRRLDLEADETNVYLRLGDLQPLVDVSIFGDNTDVRLRVPETVGLKVFGREFENYLDVIGLAERDEGFVSAGFDTLPNKIQVRLGDRLSDLTIEIY